MANLSREAVTILDQYTTGGDTGKKFSARRVKLVLSSQGGLTNQIPASVLNLAKITRSSSAVTSANVVHNTSPSYDGTYLVFAAGDQTATVILNVEGQTH